MPAAIGNAIETATARHRHFSRKWEWALPRHETPPANRPTGEGATPKRDDDVQTDTTGRELQEAARTVSFLREASEPYARILRRLDGLYEPCTGDDPYAVD